MSDAARDTAALELLRAQRGRLADRIRTPWWYLAGIALMYALVFVSPFTQRYAWVHLWVIFAAAAAVALLLGWGMNRATGIAEVAGSLAAVRGIRQELRGGGGAA
ncbi:MAG TPA: hypothetical protein VGH27_29390 [Streptosporangiaceae bacterium]|jgi:predicted MFS family arabinose efflux permease